MVKSKGKNKEDKDTSRREAILRRMSKGRGKGKQTQ